MGAVSFAVGADGSTYKASDGTLYHLTGWTLGAIAQHERYLEQRAVDAIARLKLTPEQRAQAQAALAEKIATFSLSYGSDAFDRSLRGYEGLGHFFWQLAREKHPDLELEKAVAIVRDDPAEVLDAVYAADPQNRATADKPKGQGKQGAQAAAAAPEKTPEAK